MLPIAVHDGKATELGILAFYWRLVARKPPYDCTASISQRPSLPCKREEVENLLHRL